MPDLCLFTSLQVHKPSLIKENLLFSRLDNKLDCSLPVVWYSSKGKLLSISNHSVWPAVYYVVPLSQSVAIRFYWADTASLSKCPVETA